ncbi:MAG: pyridoxal-phosphate dependent enzyme [Candidatus Bathyarchaeota archaeon]|nr:MAG: pyridoxal-phosphate dependent enzyme [Candidatus Bathyarchaeota archaeon]
MTLSAVEILEARKNLAGVVYCTPITYSRALSQLSRAEIYLKWENLQKTGAFKFRGAYNKIYSLPPEERSRGVITASTGNHALAVALVSKMMDIKATVVVPENAPKVKVEQCRDLGAEVVLKGANYDESLVYCKRMVSETGATYIPAFEDYKVIAGQGTIGCEILEEIPDTDTLIVPIGGGGLISGIALWAKTVNPKVRVVGVQSTAAYTMYECFKAKKIVDVPVPLTMADGLAGGISEMTLDLVLKYVDEIVLAEEEELKSAILWILKNERQVVEGSGAVGPAAILQGRIQFKRGEKTVAVISGGNIDMELLNLP